MERCLAVDPGDVIFVICREGAKYFSVTDLIKFTEQIQGPNSVAQEWLKLYDNFKLQYIMYSSLSEFYKNRQLFIHNIKSLS